MTHVKLSIFTLTFASILAIGCGQKPETTKTALAQELLADSSTRPMIEQQIASDHQMAMEMMPLLMEHMDSMMANGVCMNMMGKAHSSKTMAEQMCNMMASDTMMSGMMRSKLGAAPMSASNAKEHGSHHPTRK